MKTIYVKLNLMIDRELLKTVLVEQGESFVERELGIKRDVLEQIKPLTKSPYVVVITGLRRVGKSTLLSQVAHYYLNSNYYYVSFDDERLTNFEVGDFDLMYEIMVELYGEKKVWLLDEIQNIVGWERFVRRMHDSGHKLYVTGSNATLLSEELATRLTGRSMRVEVYPFSFAEYLRWMGSEDGSVVKTKDKGRMVRLLNNYIERGGIPEALKYPELSVLPTIYNDVIHRDIVSRYNLENVRTLKEMAHYLASNVGNLVSFNKIKELLKLGSVNTVKNYFEYLDSSWLFFVLNKYAYSVKEQQIAGKKLYCIDSALAQAVGFNFTSNQGKWLENLVYLQLRREKREIYYYKTSEGLEVDFYDPKSQNLIQVSSELSYPDTRERELRALTSAQRELGNKITMTIVSKDTKEQIKSGNTIIFVVPIYEWLGGR